MTFYSRDEHSASSEEYFADQRPGSFLFSQPAEVDDWCQSIPFSAGFPLTPPDTASDCAPSDCADMTSQPWTMPEESWTDTFAADNATWMPLPDNDWQSHKGSEAEPDSQAFDAGFWLSAPYGPVDTGTSPALSHESRTSRTLSSFAHPDVSLPPPGLDLSFIGIGESSWDAAVPVMPQDVDAAQQDFYAGIIGQVSSYPDADGPSTLLPAYYPTSVPSVTASSPQQSMYSAQGSMDHARRRTTSDISTVHQRPLLPRTHVHPPVPELHASRPCRALQPRKSSVGRAGTVNSVSDASGSTKESTGFANGYVPVPSVPTSHAQVVNLDPTHPVVTSAGTASHQPRPLVHMPSIPDSNALDFDSFIKDDQEDHQSAKANSYSQAYVSPIIVTAGGSSADTNVVLAKPSAETPDWPTTSALAAPIVGSTSADGDEGRHRNHPLYSKGPHPDDGLYHCPWEKDQSCQHKPAKLKCAYDKFIDSHLKPFRCKQEACSKQEFSSTACLLRHEREAHGMHGHGDRPHLCYYHGCDRAVPGNGFPRKYNLHDHMKRVHDHKEEPVADTPDFPQGDSRGPRKSGDRKRKAQGAGIGEPATQRPRPQGQEYQGSAYQTSTWSSS